MNKANGLNPRESVCVVEGRSSRLVQTCERLSVTDISTLEMTAADVEKRQSPDHNNVDDVILPTLCAN